MLRRRAVHGAAGVLSAVVVVSCAPASTATPPAHSAPAPATVAPPSGAPAHLPDLAAELLSTADLPAGWSVDATRGTGAANRGCLRVASAVTPQREAGASFVDGASGLPLFTESLGWFAGDAHAAFASAKQALDGCHTVSLSAGGETLSGVVTGLPFPSFADESAAFRVSVSANGSGGAAVLGLELVLARKGSTLISTALIDAGVPDAITLSELTAKAIAKVH
jgi:hypothetical protein